jgi:hypothetical protein
MKRLIQKLLLCAALLMGSSMGMPMRPDEVQEMLRRLSVSHSEVQGSDRRVRRDGRASRQPRPRFPS